MFDPNTIFQALLWSAVGAGLLGYGKKQGSAPAMIAGLALIGATFFLTSALALAVAGVAIVAACWAAMRYGY